MVKLQSRPKLRALDIRQQTQAGRPYYLLRDPQQITDQTLLVPQALGPLLAFCDGTHTVEEMTDCFAQRFGVPLNHDLVEDLLTALDNALFLENERFCTAHQQSIAEFRRAPSRPATLAGLSYAQSPEALWQQLQEYLEESERIEPLPVDWSRPVGLLSPHIDYQRGSSVYAQVWQRAMQAAREAELVIMLGTDHYGSDPFTLTRQNYATPYGILPTEQAVVDALVDVIGEEAAFAGELRHRGEHSLELVAVWLHHMRAGAPCHLVPILCGGFHHFFHNGKHPGNDPLLQQVVATLRQASAGRRTLVVASGDLAHVGPAFGGAPLDSSKRDELRSADESLLAHMAAGDVDGFFAAIRQINDQHNVCGVAPIYLTMQTIRAVRGEASGYASCPADERDTSTVTIGGMIFEAATNAM